MPKVKHPLLSLEATGNLGRDLVYTGKSKASRVRRAAVPVDRKTASQDSQRAAFRDCITLWHALSTAEQRSWQSNASRHHLTGYQYFMEACLLVPPVPPPVEERFEWYDAGVSLAFIWWILWQAQSFAPLVSHDITKVRLKIHWTPVVNADDVIVSIKATDVAGHPTGPDLAVVTEPGVNIGNVPDTWHDFVFPINPTLTAGITYGIVARCPTRFDQSLRWKFQNATGAYPRGIKLSSFDSGVTWFPDATDDFAFEDWGLAT